MNPIYLCFSKTLSVRISHIIHLECVVPKLGDVWMAVCARMLTTHLLSQYRGEELNQGIGIRVISW